MIKRTFNTQVQNEHLNTNIKKHLTHEYKIKRTFNTQVHDKTNI